MSTIEAGPTQERLKQADGHVSVGDENKQRRFLASTCRSGHIDRSGGRGLGTLMTRGGMSESRSWGKLDRIGGRVLNAADYERGVETNA